jgi:(R,R)-butanediol dehydrogenase / meso-butanediol dehydrogenase / diacetyl reductase
MTSPIPGSDPRQEAGPQARHAQAETARVVYAGARTLLPEPAGTQPPGPGQVRIDVAYTGICGTDLHIYHGDMDGRVSPPQVIGHEMSGRIAEVGDGVDGWQLGDHVTVMPLDWCGTCPACRAGHTHVCHELTFLGIDAAGSMQASWTVPARTLIGLPKQLALDRAALVEPTAVAVHDVRRAGLRPEERALVVGAGPIGLLIASVAAQQGADLRLIEPDSYRRALATRLGFVCLDPADSGLSGTLADWSRGAGADVAFEVSGAAAGVTTAVDALAVQGRLVQVAIHPVPREVSLHRIFWRELTLLGARLYDRVDFETAVNMVAAGRIPVTALISRIEPLGRASQAFSALESGAGVMKVLIDCQSAEADGER